MLKVIWFTHDGLGLPIAKRLIDEGNDVTVAQTQTIEELGYGGEEKPEARQRRLQVYDGILDKLPAARVLKAMKKIENKDDYLIIFDFNNLYKLAESAVAMGFSKGFFPTEEDYLLEKDRDRGKEFVKEHYPHLDVAEVQEFKKVDDAMTFMEETEDIWVLKGNSDDAKTVVPHTDNPDFAKEQIKDALLAGQKDYETKGFILEKKILGITELTPEALFWDGKLVATTIDIENKGFGAASCGPQTGCSSCLVFKTNLEDEINNLAFPPIVYQMAKKRKGLFVWDASILCEGDSYYFGEFCSNRFGWDSILAEMAMAGGPTNFFTKLMAGENPFEKTFGVTVRGFNMHREEDDRRIGSDITILMDEEQEKNIWVYDMYKKEGKKYSTGYSWDLAVFTGASNDIIRATDLAYEALAGFAFEEMYYRPKFDFLSDEYDTSVVTRYRAYNHDLYEQEDL